jgi:trans-L-3-hydroxyproline dehydratase
VETRLRTIDAHVGGEPLRLVVGGFPSLVGETMRDKQKVAHTHYDTLRRALLHEPRGHADMYGALLTEPVESDSHAGVLFMHTDGFSTTCGHGVIGVVTIAIERGLLEVPDETQIRLDTPAGTLRVAATRRDARVTQVSFVGVPSFVLFPSVKLRLGTRDLNLDVAFGGSFYAIVDSEAAGVPMMAGYLPELRKLGMQIKIGVESAIRVAHPNAPGLRGVYGTIFTGLPGAANADLRNVTVFADGQVDRSPGGDGTAAVMSVLDAMGLLPVDRPFVSESITGAKFVGTVEARTTVGDRPAILPRVTGSAWITGEHEFVVDDADPLSNGFRI